MDAKWFGCPVDDWLRHVVEIHFHPEKGSRYWIEKADELGIDARGDINGIEDIIAFGPMDDQALSCRPVEDFIPMCFLAEKKRFILGDTAGTTGPPKITAYRDDEFYLTFVEYFGYIAETLNFPKGLNWLWIGPGGPHIIGKAARMLPQRMGSMDPFAVDFDPRWIKKMSPGTMGWERYFKHIEDQALHILNTQDIGVIFSTPPVIEHIAKKMDASARKRIKGLHYGGMSLAPEFYRTLKTELYPNAVHISGYGNTLFGVCMEVEANKDGGLNYFSPGSRLILRIVPEGSPEDNAQLIKKRLEKTVRYGERGQVLFHRLDESFLILNMLERDSAGRIPPSDKAASLGLHLDGISDPAPIISSQNGRRVSLGLY